MAKKKKEPFDADSPRQPPTTDANNIQGSPSATAGPSSEVRKRKVDKEPQKVEISNAQPPPSPVVKPNKKVPRALETREIGKHYLEREKYLKLCLREMVIYLLFLIVVGLLASGQHTSSEYYLTRVMTRLFVETKFKTWGTSEIINYNDINTLEQTWEYFNHFLLNTYWEYWYSHSSKLHSTTEEENAVLFENRLIGRPRLRQLRVKSDSCTVPDDFKLMFPHCYAEYSSSSEDKDTFGPGNLSAWQYSSPSVLGSYPISGEISTYGGGGFSLDLVPQMNVTNSTIRELFHHLWMDRGSRAIILQFTTYNVNENLFCTMVLLMELPPTGGVIPSYIIYVEKFIFRDLWDYVLVGLCFVAVLFLLWYTVEEVYELTYFKWRYFNSFWNWLDFTILILGYTTTIFTIYAYFVIHGNIRKLIRTQDEHASFDKVNIARERYITALAILFFFVSIKLLKYINFNHSMNQMRTTLARASKDIACFSIIFFIVFVTFAQLGHLLFGSQVRDFRTFFHSVFALLRTSVGDFDYHQIENVNHFLGPVYFFAYIFVIYFILVNMFLAIIIDTYSEVRSSIRDQSREMQIGDLVSRWVKKVLRRCGCGKFADRHEKPIPLGDESSVHEDIQNLLKRCGFTPAEIDLFLTKYNIPRDRQLSQEEMRAKLMLNFNTQPEAARTQVPAGDVVERDELGEKMMGRIRILEDNITDVNYKIDLIDNKLDAITQIKARKNTK